MILCIVLWILSNYCFNRLEDYSIVLLANRLIFFSTTFLVLGLFLFASVFPDSEVKMKPLYRGLAIISSIIVAVIGLTPLVVKDISIESSYSSINFNYGIILYVIHFLFFFLLFIYLLAKKYREATGLVKIQLQYLLLGGLFTALGAILTNLVLPVLFNVFYLSNYGPAFLIIFVGFTFLSIVRHRFLGIRFLLGQILYYLLVSIFSLFSFFFLGWAVTKLFGGVFTIQSVLLSIILAPLFVWLFQKFNQFISLTIEKKVIYVDKHPAEVLSDFLKSISSELDVDKIAIYAVNVLKRYFDLEKVGILLFDKVNTKILYKKISGFELNGIRDLLQVVQYWKELGEDPVLLLDEIKRGKIGEDWNRRDRLSRIVKCMEKEGISAILPLNRKVQLNGIIVVGNKKNRDSFTVDDMRFLEDVIANVSVAMGRAILYKEVEKFNETLKDKVEEQTKDLREKIRELDDARKREHDMIDIMGHELRTPMTIIRNYYELLNNLMKKDIFVQEKTVNSKYRGYLDVIGKNIEREISLINVLLSATKLDDGQLELNREPVDIIESIEDGIMGHKKEANDKGLYMKFKKSSNLAVFPKVYADKIRLHEIIDNLISNAVKYTLKGGVEIYVSHDKRFAKVEVTDTGEGIAKSDIKKVGQKFYRSNQYIKGEKRSVPLVRPGGSGLGLFVTFSLVRLHGGTISLASKLGKGSTFTFTIPLVKEGVVLQPPSDSKCSGDMFEKLHLKKSEE